MPRKKKESKRTNKGFKAKMVQSGYTDDEIKLVNHSIGFAVGNIIKPKNQGKYTSANILDYVECKCNGDFICHPCKLNELRERYS